MAWARSQTAASPMPGGSEPIGATGRAHSAAGPVRFQQSAARSRGVATATAAEAIALARSAAPVLILMDVALPGMDGLEATRILKADAATRGIPIVALTAHAMKGDEQKALQAGCDGYLTKPINTRALTRTISRYIDRRDDS